MEKTILIRPKTKQQQPTYPNSIIPNEIEFEPGTAGKEFEEATLQILNSTGAGKELHLLKSSIKPGKSGAETVQINHRPGGHFIVCPDTPASTAPPKVNNEKIGDGARKPGNHDVIGVN